MEPLTLWQAIAAAQALVLAAVALRWLAGRREVRTVQAEDFADGQARCFVPLCVVSDDTAGGTYLADASTRRPVEFSGVRAAQVQHRHRLGSDRSAVVIVLEGLKRVSHGA